jgi:eukaryotic-like serine/threonine-protein kinase
MAKIKLEKAEWHYDPKSTIGDVGGFGRVHDGTDSTRKHIVAVKKLNISADDAGHRELDIARVLMNRDVVHVMPILDSGIDANTGRYFIVMPKAEMSLEDATKRVGQFTEVEAVQILLDIAKGLNEVIDIVHRDLKPANILFHEGKWKIADFGIARFVESATSQNTVKEFLSPTYAAPEQWNSEHAVNATDIYALGCIAYALLTGKPPFEGSREDCKVSHLNNDPKPLNEIFTPLLRSTISLTLRKSSDVRPSISRVIDLLMQIQSKNTDSSLAFTALSRVGAAEAQKLLKAESDAKKKQAIVEKREKAANEALKILFENVDFLIAKILKHAPTAEEFNGRNIGGLIGEVRNKPVKGIKIGEAKLVINTIGILSEDTFPQSKWDVLAGAMIQVEQPMPSPYLWGASLWYTNLSKGLEYRWYEIPYFGWGGRSKFAPQALMDLLRADLAASTITMPPYQHASDKPCPIDMDGLENFAERWALILAKAYHGELRRPSNLPIHNYCSNDFLKP